MKKIYLTILYLLCFSTVFSQNNKIHDFYKLYKEGDSIRKVVVFFNSERKDLNKKPKEVFFTLENQKFHYNEKIHTCNSLSLESYNKMNFNNSKNLFQIEEKEFLKQSLIVEKEKGFKPLPPIGESLLNIYIICKVGNEFFEFQVDWIKSKF